MAHQTYKSQKGAEKYRDELRRAFPRGHFILGVAENFRWCVIVTNEAGKRIAIAGNRPRNYGKV